MDKLTNLFASTKGDNGKPKWWLVPVAILVLLVGLFIASSILKRNRGELAKLRHEKRKAEILEAQERSDAQRAPHEKAAKEAAQRADKAAQRIEGIDANIKRLEERHAGDQRVVDLLVWSDLPRAE
jgi:hypothetical protein